MARVLLIFICSNRPPIGTPRRSTMQQYWAAIHRAGPPMPPPMSRIASPVRGSSIAANPLGRQHAVAVEMIERRQRVRRDRRIGAEFRVQRRDDTGGDAAARAGAGVVVLDAFA